MSIRFLPAQNNTNWYGHYGDLDAAARLSEVRGDAGAVRQFYGYQTWTIDPIFSNTTQAMASGTQYYNRVPVVPGQVLTNLHAFQTVVGAGLTFFKGALYDQDGLLLRTTGDLTTAWNTTGHRAAAFQSAGVDSPYAVPTGVNAVYLSLLAVGTTAPTISRPAAGASFATMRMGIVGLPRLGQRTGLTDFPENLSGGGDSNALLWLAAS